MLVRLNVFQKTMLYWNDVLPYNAVHVVRFDGDPQIGAIENAINEVLRSRNLGDLWIDDKKDCFHFGTEFIATPFAAETDAEDILQALDRRVETELNTSFDIASRFNPFRAFVVAGQGAYYLGLVYFHAVSDGESIIKLVQSIIDRFQLGSHESLADFQIRSAKLWKLPFKRPDLFVSWVFALPRHVKQIQTFFRAPTQQNETARTVFSLWSLDCAKEPPLLDYARALKVTLNDVFLGALIKSLSPYACERLSAERRRALGIVCITNLRRDLSGRHDKSFGVHLGSFHVTHESPPNIELAQLIQDVHAQTMQIKSKKLYALNSFTQAVGIYMLRRLTLEKRRRFYAKNYPTWAGMTNMDLSWYWKDYPADTFDYFRAASVSPATPLVLVITTVKRRINVAVSFSPHVYSRDLIENVMMSFLGHLSDLEEKR